MGMNPIFSLVTEVEVATKVATVAGVAAVDGAATADGACHPMVIPGWSELQVSPHRC